MGSKEISKFAKVLNILAPTLFYNSNKTLITIVITNRALIAYKKNIVRFLFTYQKLVLN
jgi:hypothetical protein